MALAMLLFAGIGPLGNWLILPLEERFAQGWGGLHDPPTGIIVLAERWMIRSPPGAAIRWS